jgi:hypothetical protein
MGLTDRPADTRHLDDRRTYSPEDDDGHEGAVVHAEVNRLVRALRPYGVLRRDVLARTARAGSWHEAGFERALRRAVEEHRIEELALGFYRLPHTASKNTHPNSGETAV